MAKSRTVRWIQEALGVRPRRKGYGPHHVKSVRVEAKHKGALHRMLGVPTGQKISMTLLREAAAHPERFYKRKDTQLKLMRRARFALNVPRKGRK
jgi:hypothetical protein